MTIYENLLKFIEQRIVYYEALPSVINEISASEESKCKDIVETFKSILINLDGFDKEVALADIGYTLGYLHSVSITQRKKNVPVKTIRIAYSEIRSELKSLENAENILHPKREINWHMVDE
jgi:hypothetical protein